jgi:hypothetical protein
MSNLSPRALSLSQAHGPGPVDWERVAVIVDGIVRMPDDPQLDALVQASGHTREDALIILAELNRIGWSVRPITGILRTLPTPPADAEKSEVAGRG